MKTLLALTLSVGLLGCAASKPKASAQTPQKKAPVKLPSTMLPNGGQTESGAAGWGEAGRFVH